MASAVLARSSEPHWPESTVYMRKPHPNSRKKSNPNFDRFEYSDHAPGPAPHHHTSDDESAFNRRADTRVDSDGYVTYTISAFNGPEMRELKRRLEAELEQVRAFSGRIESREIQSSAVGASGIYAAGGGGAREVTSSAHGSEGYLQRPCAPRGGGYYSQQQKAYSGGRPLVSPKGAKRLAATPAADKALAAMMTRCKQILVKLMKQKKMNWFSSPVDAKKLNLHDYHLIVEHPMDLGTVKSNINKGVYGTPMEFADDVRLTFQNALKYNPKGHEVHDLAGKFLRTFDNEFNPAHDKYLRQQAVIAREEEERQMTASWTHDRLPESPPQTYHIPDYSPARPPQPREISPSPPRQVLAHVPMRDPSPEHIQQQQQYQQTMPVKPSVPKLPKPKAKDLYKRPMTMDEKESLSEGLQSLPQEKMEHVLQIVKKRSGELVQDGDEIELDFEAMDAETLWELQRFVYNCKKMLSKMRRAEAMSTGILAPPSSSAQPEDLNEMHQEHADQLPPMAEAAPDRTTTAAKSIKRTDHGDEEAVDIGDDVDIGDNDMVGRDYPSVEIEKDNASSGSDSSSSSSGSDSDSSSSDSDDAQSPARSPAAVGSRSSP